MRAQGHVPGDADRLQLQERDQQQRAVGDHLLRNGERVRDGLATGGDQGMVVLLVLTLGGAKDDHRILSDIQLPFQAALARYPEQRYRRGLHGGEGIESGLQGITVSHDEG